VLTNKQTEDIRIFQNRAILTELSINSIRLPLILCLFSPSILIKLATLLLLSSSKIMWIM